MHAVTTVSRHDKCLGVVYIDQTMAREGYNDDLGLGQTLRGFTAGQKLFNRYTLQRTLGRGGMGVVWLAQDDQLEEQVALKFLPETVTNEPEAISDLKHETKRSRELNHHYIVRIHDFVQDELAAGISMEYVDGRTMTELKLKQPARCFNARDLMGLVAQVCEALEYAHTVAKVVHRDLKPSNLMINSKRQLKVTDFGIARSIADTASRLSEKLGTSGTPAYMSPQQANGEKASPADDIYALGATLYELLTSKPPFYSGDVLDQLKHKVPVRIGERRRELGIEGEEVPVHWEETIAACLGKDPVQRPTSAAEAAKRLLAGVKFEKGASLARLAEAGEISPKLQSARRWRTSVAKWIALGVILVGLGLTLSLKLGLGGMKPSPGRLYGSPDSSESRAASPSLRTVMPRQRWTNSLGLPFVPVPGTEVLFSIWDARVQDFEAFVQATGYDAAAGMVSLGSNGYQTRGATWRSPGFAQGLTHPVVGVSWIDAKAFCKWLTEKERRTGMLQGNQLYRLPTDREWSTAVGLPDESGNMPAEKDGRITGIYPWGTQWPPPSGAGNFAGEEAQGNQWPENRFIVKGYRDPYPQTAPVGSFTPNQFGLYDMGGNAHQWCEDWFDNHQENRVGRGSAWSSGQPKWLASCARAPLAADSRRDFLGFRVVLAADSP
jgi:serine/threonine protein kinase